MNGLAKLPDHPIAKWLALGVTVVGAGAFLASRDVRNAIADVYDARWPLAVAVVGLVAVVFLVRRGGSKVRLVRTSDDLVDELRSTVRTAEKRLCCIGSRARDKAYLDEVEERLRSNRKLKYTRILVGPPHRDELKTHLVNLMHDNTFSSQVSIHLMPLSAAGEQEQTLCASERRAVIILPALGEVGRYDSAVVLNESKDVDEVLSYFDGLCNTTHPSLTTAAVDALEPTETQQVGARPISQ